VSAGVKLSGKSSSGRKHPALKAFPVIQRPKEGNWICNEWPARQFHKTNNNPFKPKLLQILFKTSVCTAKKIPHFTVPKINLLTLFKETIAAYSENYIKSITQRYWILVITVA
jgi:hypothetical protein